MIAGVFLAELPKKLKEGDKILIKGTALGDNKEFDIIFSNGSHKCDDNVTYRLKCILRDNIFLGEYRTENKWFYLNQTKLKIKTFEYQFEFKSETVNVNIGNETPLEYNIKGDIGEIKSVQVHGDFVHVKELAMEFK